MRRGFTATEFLIVVGVVGLAAALVLPVLSRGNARAARSACLQKTKEIGAALMLYANDWDAVLPRTSEERPKRGLGAHWTYVVQPYVRSNGLFVCPARPEQPYYSDGSVDTRRRVPVLGYLNNYAAIPAHDFYPVPLSSLTDTAGLILIAERRSQTPGGVRLRGWKGTSGFWPGQPCADQELGVGYFRAAAPEARGALARVRSDKDLLLVRVDWSAHDGISNYTFADGHARPESLERTLEPTRFQWGERFYARSMADAECDGRPGRRKDRP